MFLSRSGKEVGDRHPKISDNVLIGASATILGNIHVGKGAQVRLRLTLRAAGLRTTNCAGHHTVHSSTACAHIAARVVLCRGTSSEQRVARAQVAAGSLVLKPVAPKTMVAGSPAQVVGTVDGAELRASAACVSSCVRPRCWGANEGVTLQSVPPYWQ